MARNYAFINPDILIWARRRSQLSQSVLAKKMSTSAETLNKWEMGQKAPLSGDILQYAQQLMAKYPRPSRNDCFALALAANLSLPLLTGDKHLRSATKREGVTVMGSLWLFVEIENQGLVTKESLTIALKKMKDGGRLLPWQKTESQQPSK
jgi:predicted nucleic acid-binding protein